jgi:hypothetical protein
MKISAVDGGDFLSDEVLQTLEYSHLQGSDQECYLSMHVMSSQPQQKDIQIRGLVKNQPLVILLDSGSSHTFLNSRISNELQLSSTPVPHMTIRVANGASLSCVAKVMDFE